MVMFISDNPYARAHKLFKKEFKAFRDYVRGTNRYDLKKLVGRKCIVERMEDNEDLEKDYSKELGRDGVESEFFKDSDNESEVAELEKDNPHYSFSTIDGCELTRVKEDSSSYAIGDSDGRPITDFDFIYVAKEAEGDKHKTIEVITKDGDAKRFSVERETVEECMGVAALGGGGSTSEGGGTTTPTSDTCQGIGVENGAIKYADVQKELLTPTKERMCFLYGAAKGRNRKWGRRIKRRKPFSQ